MAFPAALEKNKELDEEISAHLAIEVKQRLDAGETWNRSYSRGWHDAMPVCASDARGGGAASARANGDSPETSGLGCWIWQCRRNEARLRPAVGDHSAYVYDANGNLAAEYSTAAKAEAELMSGAGLKNVMWTSVSYPATL